jgi:hypothetical protein
MRPRQAAKFKRDSNARRRTRRYALSQRSLGDGESAANREQADTKRHARSLRHPEMMSEDAKFALGY